MPYRGLSVSLFMLLVGGCALPAYQIASWTVSGVSYVFSGKSIGDHALSLALDKDCATLRALQGKNICDDYDGTYPDRWSALASTWRLPTIESPNIDSPTTVAALQPPADDVEANVLAFASNPFENSVPAAAPRAPDFDIAATPAVLVTDEDDTSWVRGSQTDGPQAPESQDQARGLDFEGLLPDGPDTGALRPASFIARDTAPAVYLVIGSFADRKYATRLGNRYPAIATTIHKVVTAGRVRFRVLAGPFESNALTATRIDLAKAGIHDSWAVRLCRGSLALPPCDPVVQQASLP